MPRHATPVMNAKAVVAALVLALAAYFAIIGYRGVYLVGQHSWELKLLGVGVLILPLVGVWAVVAELRFGMATERLGRRLAGEGTPAGPALPRSAAGRVDRCAADEWFDAQRAVVVADPRSWRGWYGLALAYDLAGDRRRARSAMRTAIELAAG